METYTMEDLLQYLYKETSPERTAAIKAAIESDWDLREKFETITSTVNKLEPVTLSPRDKTIDFIMNYAEKPVEELSSHA